MSSLSALCLVLAAACVGRHHAALAPVTCKSTARAVVPAAPLDLTAATPYRNYVAVRSVGPFAHHFAVLYLDVEPVLLYLAARVDDHGGVIVEHEGGYSGGVAARDAPPSPTPADRAQFERAVERELRSQCTRVPSLITYRGSYRSVWIEQFIAHDLRGGASRTGWFGRRELRVDETLSHVLGEGDGMNGWGRIEVPGESRWVELAAADTGARGLVPIAGSVAERVLAAARELEAKAPAPALAAVPVVASAALLPPGYRARVVFALTLHGRSSAGADETRDVRIPLDVHDAVFARATGDAEVALGAVHYKVHATLVPEAARKASSAREEAPYRGTLHVEVDNDRGHSFMRDYTASGSIHAQGDAVVAPSGFDLPGASSPSRAHDLLHHTFTSDGEHTSVDVDVQVSLFDDPRKDAQSSISK